MRKLVASAMLAIVIGIGPADANHGTSQSQPYVGTMDIAEFIGAGPTCGDVNFARACFAVNENGLSALHIDVTDASGLDVTAYASVYTTQGVIGEQQFCGENDIQIGSGVGVQQVVVHVGGVQEGGCGPLQVLPKEIGPVPAGAFSFGTTGEVVITYS